MMIISDFAHEVQVPALVGVVACRYASPSSVGNDAKTSKFVEEEWSGRSSNGGSAARPFRRRLGQPR